MNSLWGWVGFNVVVLAILALDLGVLHRRAVKVSLKEAGTWSAVWVAADGQGLLSMQRRAEKLGGALKIESRPASGTTINLRIPLAFSPLKTPTGPYLNG